MVSDAFLVGVIALAQSVGADPEHLLRVWNAESGLNPRAINPDGDARGINQSTKGTLRGNGLTEDQINAYPAWSDVQQLSIIARQVKSLRAYAGRPLDTPAMVYASVFWPASLKRWDGDSTIVVASGDMTPYVAGKAADGKTVYTTPDAAYKANRGLDANNDGVIDGNDLNVRLNKAAASSSYRAVVARLRELQGGGATTVPTVPVLPRAPEMPSATAHDGRANAANAAFLAIAIPLLVIIWAFRPNLGKS